MIQCFCILHEMVLLLISPHDHYGNTEKYGDRNTHTPVSWERHQPSFYYRINRAD